MRTQDGKTKKDLRGAIKAVMLLAALAQTAQVWAGSTEGTSLGQQEIVAQEATTTKAYLTIEDLKTLLGLTARDPSAVESQLNKEAATGSYDFVLSLSKVEKNTLHRTIHKIERTRTQLEAQLNKDVATQKAELRRQRRTLQASRLSAGPQNDDTISRSIFESILSESNLEVRAAQQLEAFDQSHLVSIDFSSVGGLRVVNTIAMGDETVWSMNSASRLAAK